MERRLERDDPTFRVLLRRSLMPLAHVDPFNHNPVTFRDHAKHTASLTPVVAGDNRDLISTTNVHIDPVS